MQPNLLAPLLTALGNPATAMTFDANGLRAVGGGWTPVDDLREKQGYSYVAGDIDVPLLQSDGVCFVFEYENRDHGAIDCNGSTDEKGRSLGPRSVQMGLG